MPISLQQLRSYSGNGAILVSKDATGADRLSEAGAGHRLKSFFGVASAADANRRTFNAVLGAIQSDPRFFAPDLLRRADELLRAAAGDGKVLSADRIRSVVAQLDAMSDPASRRAASATARFAITPTISRRYSADARMSVIGRASSSATFATFSSNFSSGALHPFNTAAVFSARYGTGPTDPSAIRQFPLPSTTAATLACAKSSPR